MGGGTSGVENVGDFGHSNVVDEDLRVIFSKNQAEIQHFESDRLEFSSYAHILLSI